MTIAGGVRQALAAWSIATLVAGCALPAPEPEAPSSAYPGYPGAASGSPGDYGGGRNEYRGPLPSGSYTESCRDMRVDRDHRRLEAECRRLDGRWRYSSLDLRDCDRNIINDNGWLVCLRQEVARLPAGSYRESCRDFTIEKGRLEARCRRRNGQWRETDIDLSRCKSPIRNDDGHLVCGRPLGG